MVSSTPIITLHTLALASRVASASAAIARCKLAGSRTSLLQLYKRT